MDINELQLRLDKLKYGVKKDDDNDNNNTGRGGGCEWERQVCQVHQQLHNKKWMIYFEGLIIFAVILQMFLHTILENKVLELLREKIMKSLLINKLNKGREKFEICQRELLIKENQA